VSEHRGKRHSSAYLRRTVALAAALAPLLCATLSYAREVTVPMRLDLAFVRQALVQQIYTEPGEKAALWDDGTGCGWLDLYEPKVNVVDGRMRIVSRGDARIGTPLAGECLVALDWKGFVEVFESPQLDTTGRLLTFKVVDSNIYDERHEKRFTTGKLWDLVKKYVQPRLEAWRIDLTQPFDELRAWLPLLLPGSQERIDHLVASLQVRDPHLAEGGIAVTLAFDVEPRTPTASPTPEPTLSPAELAAWQTRWQQWDAFLTFVVKRFAQDSSGQLRRAVLDVLLDARYELLDALAPPYPGAPDPVPGFFLHTWTRLAPILRKEAQDLPASTALEYTSFITAGDALAALNQLGPELGVEVSADGLRRLARMVAPASIEDPLAYSTDVDPELRTLLGLGSPLPPPSLSPDVELDLSARSRLLRPISALASGGSKVLAGSMSWFERNAFAAIAPDTIAKLNRWAPTRNDIDTYLPLVRDLLRQVADQTLATAGLETRFRSVYRHIVLAAAWQESCWRQYVRAGGKLVPLKSAVGSVGMMQVNVHVWRGVYDLKGLLADIVYNGRAGSEILMHYLSDYAIAKGEQSYPGGIDNLARATYAVYNGGPAQLSRYRAKHERKSLKKIDDLFWQKYQAVRNGNEMEVATCYTD
jgi:hypothetical protein